MSDSISMRRSGEWAEPTRGNRPYNEHKESLVDMAASSLRRAEML